MGLVAEVAVLGYRRFVDKTVVYQHRFVASFSEAKIHRKR